MEVHQSKPARPFQFYSENATNWAILRITHQSRPNNDPHTSSGGWVESNKDDKYPCMYVYMYVCMYVCMYVRTYVCMYVRMYVCTYVCMYVCMDGWMDGCMDVWMYE